MPLACPLELNISIFLPLGLNRNTGSSQVLSLPAFGLELTQVFSGLWTLTTNTPLALLFSSLPTADLGSLSFLNLSRILIISLCVYTHTHCFSFWPPAVWDLGTLTRDQTHNPCIGSSGS